MFTANYLITVIFAIRQKSLLVILPIGKNHRANWDSAEHHLHGKYPGADAWQISAVGRKDYVTPDGVRIAPAMQLLATLV